MHQVLRLPHKTISICTKCCACHAKVAPCTPNAVPATQKVLRLPRKSSRMCTKCRACYAKITRTQAATKRAAAIPKESNASICHGKDYPRAPNVTPTAKQQPTKPSAHPQSPESQTVAPATPRDPRVHQMLLCYVTATGQPEPSGNQTHLQSSASKCCNS